MILHIKLRVYESGVLSLFTDSSSYRTDSEIGFCKEETQGINIELSQNSHY